MPDPDGTLDDSAADGGGCCCRVCDADDADKGVAFTIWPVCVLVRWWHRNWRCKSPLASSEAGTVIGDGTEAEVTDAAEATAAGVATGAAGTNCAKADAEDRESLSPTPLLPRLPIFTPASCR